MNRSLLLIMAAALASVAQAQSVGPMITEAKTSYNNVKNFILKAAEKMPEADYGFKPTPELQSFGQRVAHIAGQIRGCSSLTGEPKQSTAKPDSKKEELVAALKASFDACDAAWESMNEKTAVETVAGRGGAQRPKLAALIGNTMHIDEVYGTMTVYMRLKGVVPPSSEGR